MQLNIHRKCFHNIWLALNLMGKKKRIIITPGIPHYGFHWKNSGEELDWCWRRVTRTDVCSQCPCTCPKHTKRNQHLPNPSTNPPRGATVPQQQRADDAVTAKPRLSSKGKAKAPCIFWVHSYSFSQAFLHLDHNPLSRINK